MNRFPGLILVWLTASSAFAGTTPFLITNRTSDLDSSIPLEASMLAVLNSTCDSLQTSVNTGFLAQPLRQAFADDLAIANTSPTASLIADRGSDFSRFSIGGGLQGGFFWQGNASTNANNKIPQLGAGLEGAVVIGFRGTAWGGGSIGPLDAKRLSVFLSAMTGSTSYASISASALNVGLNFQYDVVRSIGFVLLGWNGLKFLTGFNYAQSGISYSGNLNQSTSATISGQTATIAANLNYNIGATNTDFYVPLELSTGFRLFYLFTVYGGGAADLNFGTSSLTGSGGGPISATASTNFGVANVFSGNAVLNLNDATVGHPSLLTMRGFAGVQVNLWFLHVDVQGSVLNNGAESASVLLRAAI